MEFFQSPSTYSDLHDSCPTREAHPQPHSKDLGQLSCTLEPLGEFKTHWYLDPTLRESDVIGLGCGLCISRSSPAGAEVQPQLESADPDPVPEPRHLFHSSPAQVSGWRPCFHLWLLRVFFLDFRLAGFIVAAPVSVMSRTQDC